MGFLRTSIRGLGAIRGPVLRLLRRDSRRGFTRGREGVPRDGVPAQGPGRGAGASAGDLRRSSSMTGGGSSEGREERRQEEGSGAFTSSLISSRARARSNPSSGPRGDGVSPPPPLLPGDTKHHHSAGQR